MNNYMPALKEGTRLYTVTDPCYLVNHERWSQCCKNAEKSAVEKNIKYGWDEDAFSEQVEKALREANGNAFAFACGTGFGDWTNAIGFWNKGSGKTTIEGASFGADAGMVCVVEVTQELLDYLEKTHSDNAYEIGAFIRTDSKMTGVMTEGHNSWEVLRIMLNDGTTIKTMEYGEDDYEEDDYEEDDESWS